MATRHSKGQSSDRGGGADPLIACRRRERILFTATMRAYVTLVMLVPFVALCRRQRRSKPTVVRRRTAWWCCAAADRWSNTGAARLVDTRPACFRSANTLARLLRRAGAVQSAAGSAPSRQSLRLALRLFLQPQLFSVPVHRPQRLRRSSSARFSCFQPGTGCLWRWMMRLAIGFGGRLICLADERRGKSTRLASAITTTIRHVAQASSSRHRLTPVPLVNRTRST